MLFLVKRDRLGSTIKYMLEFGGSLLVCHVAQVDGFADTRRVKYCLRSQLVQALMSSFSGFSNPGKDGDTLYTLISFPYNKS